MIQPRARAAKHDEGVVLHYSEEGFVGSQPELDILDKIAISDTGFRLPRNELDNLHERRKHEWGQADKPEPEEIITLLLFRRND
jgi:hypothetical protein